MKEQKFEHWLKWAPLAPPKVIKPPNERTAGEELALALSRYDRWKHRHPSRPLGLALDIPARAP